MHEALTKLIIETEIERATAKAVLIILSKFTNIECECFPSISTITQLSSMSRSTTIRSLNWLDQAGYISRVKKHRQPTRYKIEMDTLMDRNNKPLKIKSESPLGVTVTPQDKRVVSLSNYTKGNTSSQLSTSGVILSATFNDFWDVYPRRIGKGHARIAFVKACKIADPSVIVTAAKQYASIAPTSEMKFIPYPATWLNGERWEDDMTVINEQTNTNRLKNILNLDDIWDDTPSVEHQKVAQIDCKGR